MNPSFDGVTRKGEQQVIPIRGGVYRQWWEAPLAADATVIEDEVALSTVSVTVPLSYTMDFPRNVQVDFGGTTTDVNAGTVSVQGTNVLDETISENLTVIENQSTASVGAKAFKTVTQVLFTDKTGLELRLVSVLVQSSDWISVFNTTLLAETLVLERDLFMKRCRQHAKALRLRSLLTRLTLKRIRLLSIPHWQIQRRILLT